MSGLFSNPRELAGSIKEQEALMSGRRRMGRFWMAVFYVATILSIMALVSLAANIVNGAFGFVALRYHTAPEAISTDNRSFRDYTAPELIALLYKQTEVFLEDSDKGISPNRLAALADQVPLEERSRENLIEMIEDEVLQPEIEKTWSLVASIFQQNDIQTWIKEEDDPQLSLEFRSWVTMDFITSTQSSEAGDNGVRSALLGSIFIIGLTLLFAFPIGVGTAIFLEEFAPKKSWFARIVQINIYNLSGVPSIIYGILGLAIFVRGLEGVTQGRSILAASLTLALLILPIIIINSQEAIRAVPQSLRDSSLALGGTRWMTVWHHVLPASIDRILTGTIFAVSRALGETAPLVVVGAATFLQEDPTSIFARFTALPIQIYQWTSRPQEEFRNIAAAAIIVLLILLFTMNAAAIIMRNRISAKRRANS